MPMIVSIGRAPNDQRSIGEDYRLEKGTRRGYNRRIKKADRADSPEIMTGGWVGSDGGGRVHLRICLVSRIMSTSLALGAQVDTIN